MPFLLVMIQPDLGNAIIYIVIVLGMLWIGNVQYTHVLIGLAIVVGALDSVRFAIQYLSTQKFTIILTNTSKGPLVRADQYVHSIPERLPDDDVYQSEYAQDRHRLRGA